MMALCVAQEHAHVRGLFYLMEALSLDCSCVVGAESIAKLFHVLLVHRFSAYVSAGRGIC